MTDQLQSVKNPAGGRRLSAAELRQEAKRQSQALKMIGRWRAIGFIVSTVGAVLIYNGISGTGRNFPLTAAGAVIAIAGLAVAVLCDMGIRNGRRNVEKILEAAQDTSVRRENIQEISVQNPLSEMPVNDNSCHTKQGVVK
jgi:hypothetical protein